MITEIIRLKFCWTARGWWKSDKKAMQIAREKKNGSISSLLGKVWSNGYLAIFNNNICLTKQQRHLNDEFNAVRNFQRWFSSTNHEGRVDTTHLLCFQTKKKRKGERSMEREAGSWTITNKRLYELQSIIVLVLMWTIKMPLMHYNIIVSFMCTLGHICITVHSVLTYFSDYSNYIKWVYPATEYLSLNTRNLIRIDFYSWSSEHHLVIKHPCFSSYTIVNVPRIFVITRIEGFQFSKSHFNVNFYRSKLEIIVFSFIFLLGNQTDHIIILYNVNVILAI